MDYVFASVMGGLLAYSGVKLYKQLFPPADIFVQPKSMLDSQVNPVYTFQLSRNPDKSVNIEQITSNVILANKTELVNAIKYTLTEYGKFSDVNSYIFYYGELPLLKLISDEQFETNVISRIPRSSSNGGFKIVFDKNYHFDGRIPDTYDLSLTPEGFLDISNHLTLYNYPTIIKSIASESGNFFFGVSEIIFTYYNIPLFRLRIIGQEDESRSLTMDLA